MFCSFEKEARPNDSAVEADNRSDYDVDSEVEANDSREMSDALEHDDDDDDDDDASEEACSGKTEELANDKDTSSTFHTGSYRSHFVFIYLQC